MFVTNPHLPFGNVGNSDNSDNSGIGRYHGECGFQAVSQIKAVTGRGTLLDPDLRYPPFNNFKFGMINMRRLLSSLYDSTWAP